jgi:hypothetical protein
MQAGLSAFGWTADTCMQTYTGRSMHAYRGTANTCMHADIHRQEHECIHIQASSSMHAGGLGRGMSECRMPGRQMSACRKSRRCMNACWGVRQAHDAMQEVRQAHECIHSAACCMKGGGRARARQMHECIERFWCSNRRDKAYRQTHAAWSGSGRRMNARVGEVLHACALPHT